MVTSCKPKKGVAINSDAAKKAKALLDTISVAGVAATALKLIKDKFVEGSQPAASDARDLETIINALNQLEKVGRHQTAKVSPVSHLLCAYDMRRPLDVANFERENPRPKSTSDELWKLKCSTNGTDKLLSKQSAEPLSL